MRQDIAASASGKIVRKGDLFRGFLKIGLIGFGGIAPWARHVVVEERGWLTDKEFAAILGIGQILPGSNTINAAIMIGDRFQGVGGALVSLFGLMAAPLVVVTALDLVYEHFSSVPEVHAAVVGAAEGAAGLVAGTALKMIRTIRPAPLALLIGAAAFAMVGLLGWPLVPVVIALVPISLAGTLMERRG